MTLSDSEKRDVINLIESGKILPERFRFLLFEKSKQVELNWNGKSENVTNLVLPFQIIEQIDEPRDENIEYEQPLFDGLQGKRQQDWTNKLIWGDNKYILSSLKNGPLRDDIENAGGIKLIYIDPPFDVGADFTMNVEVGEENYEKKPNILEQIAYRDTWGLGEDSYLSMIYERLFLMKDLLSDDGSIFVHCDQRLNSRLRNVLYEVFGEDNFVNEIIWQRTTAGKPVNKNLPKNADYIIWFSKTSNYQFNGFTSNLTKKNILNYNKDDNDGRGPYTTQPIINPANRPNLKYTYIDNLGRSWVSPKNGWRFNEDRMRMLEKDNKLFFTETSIREKQYLSDRMEKGQQLPNVWTDINGNNVQNSQEGVDYPTQKPEELVKRIIKGVTNEGDLICDFFAGSGTLAAVAEKLHRKWICSDIGKFSIHTIRKRMIGIQRELKNKDENWRAFEILNLGKYQRNHYIYDRSNIDDPNKQREKEKRESEFRKLILSAYQANEVNGFSTIHGHKGGSVYVSLGPINQPLSRNHVEEVISECLKNNITAVDILGFEYEMGLFPTIQEEAKLKGLRLSYKQIPMEVFDKRAVQKNEVIFHDVAYIEVKPHIDGQKISIELTDFAVFYNEDNLGVEESLKNGKSKIVVENGNIVEKSKNMEGIVSEKLLTENWHDWIDYWAIDFDYESKKEIIKVFMPDGKIVEEWTGNYVFENEWQSFRGKYKLNKNEEFELISSKKEISMNKTKIAIKVVDIFGNDTMKVIDINF